VTQAHERLLAVAIERITPPFKPLPARPSYEFEAVKLAPLLSPLGSVVNQRRRLAFSFFPSYRMQMSRPFRLKNIVIFYSFFGPKVAGPSFSSPLPPPLQDVLTILPGARGRCASFLSFLKPQRGTAPSLFPSLLDVWETVSPGRQEIPPFLLARSLPTSTQRHNSSPLSLQKTAARDAGLLRQDVTDL